jgi:hypothetical protein
MIEEKREASVQMLEGTVRGLVQDYGRTAVRAAFDTVIGPRTAPPCDNEACGERCAECNVCVACLCAEHDQAVSKFAKEHLRLQKIVLAILNKEQQP